MADRTVRVRLEVEAAGARQSVKGFAGELKQLEGAVGATGKASDTAGNQIRNLGSETGKAREHVGGLAGAVQKLADHGGIGLALGGLGALEILKRTVGGASDLNETVSKSQQVFKGSAGSILEWSSTSATSMGLSQRAALDGASSFQNLFSQIGLSGDASVKMSKNLVQLSSDFASFHNAAPEEVMDALLSATRGEYDALQRFVPTVTAAAIQQQALADTGKASATELTNAEKATALYNIVVHDAGAATGDFARTSNSAANEQRVFVAELENSAAAVGKAALPAYQGLLGVVNDIGPGTIVAAAGVAVLSNRISSSAGNVKIFDDLRAATSLYTESVATGTPRITAAMDTAKAATVGLRGAGSAVVGLFGGPWGLALTAATVGVGLLAGKMQESKQKTDQAIASYVKFGEAVQNASNQEQVRDLIKHDEAIQSLIRETDKYGLSSNTVVRALAGEKMATDQINTALSQRREELVKTIAEHTVQGGKSGAIMDDQAQKARNEVQAIDQLRGSFGEAAKKQTEAAQAAGTYTEATYMSKKAAEEHAATVKNLSDMAGSLGPNFKNLAGVVGLVTDETKTGKDAADVFAASLIGIAASTAPAEQALTQYQFLTGQVAGAHLNASQKADEYGGILKGVADTAGGIEPTLDLLGNVFGQIAGAELTATDKASLLKQAWQQMYQPSIDQNDAVEAFNLSLFTLSDQLDKGSRSLDINNAAGVRNADAVEALVQKNNDLYFANIASGVSAEDAARQHEANGKKIEEAGHKAGLTTQEVAVLNGKYGDIPRDVNTNIRTTGAEAVLNQLRDMKIAQMALQQGIDVSEARKQFRNSTGQGGGGLAGGGRIPGPPSAVDNLVAMGPWGPLGLATGEFVVNAKQTQKHIGILSAINSGMDGFADGGVVWPFPVNVAKTLMPDIMTAIMKQISSASGGGNLGAWIASAIMRTGVGPSWAGPLRVLIMRESGGNPNSINLTDSNAAAGDPSRGLMQTIGSTFNTYRDRDLSSNIYDPIANIVAGINYIKSRYGSIFNVQQANPNLPPMGYAGGGPVGPVKVYDQGGPWPSGTYGFNGSGRTEWVNAPGSGGGMGGASINVTINAGMGADGYQLGQQVADVLKTYIRSAGGGNVQVALGKRGA